MHLEIVFFEASNLVSTKALLLEHYYHRQGSIHNVHFMVYPPPRQKLSGQVRSADVQGSVDGGCQMAVRVSSGNEVPLPLLPQSNLPH